MPKHFLLMDMNGNHTTDDKASNNGFYLRYVRLQAKFEINKITAQVLINLADFKNNPQTRVLELANLKYKIITICRFKQAISSLFVA